MLGEPIASQAHAAHSTSVSMGVIMKHVVGQAAIASLLVLGFSIPAAAHCIIGNRFFPATLQSGRSLRCRRIVAADDRRLQEWRRTFGAGAGHLRRIFEDDHAEFRYVVRGGLDPSRHPGRRHHSGFDNLGTSFKYQFVGDAAGELAMSIALDVDWGGTGSSAVDAEPFTTLAPTLFLGKGSRLYADVASSSPSRSRPNWATRSRQRSVERARRGHGIYRPRRPIHGSSSGAARCNTACPP